MNEAIERNLIQEQIKQGEILSKHLNGKQIDHLLIIIDILALLVSKDYNLSRDKEELLKNVKLLYPAVRVLFKKHLTLAGSNPKKIDAISTKFNDSGPRSAPWKPTSSRVPGRPQDGEDGNRTNRWHLPEDHKFYATEIDAKLVGIKYFLQALSMEGAPPLPPNSIQNSFIWLLGHRVEPGQCLDPIQLEPISFLRFIENPRSIESGHVIPLDRGGKHIPSNTFLMESQSNRIQNNLTLDELWVWIEKILRKHQPELFKE
ncbi:MAG: hypothetical protein I4E98_17550 [Planktothrix agardhii KL2]|jgi:hypothetical protein|uniref:hypothetical protein n=1 Tax=Planktothrix agardhii TaxID=1160 RepID=UPI001A199367|nr:hypothetical protein [Planktothrix agardhii]MBG0748374.1 hypothetical protein [Planktothrix agardhii KL2]